jgi:hypothetical protein
MEIVQVATSMLENRSCLGSITALERLPPRLLGCPHTQVREVLVQARLDAGGGGGVFALELTSQFLLDPLEPEAIRHEADPDEDHQNEAGETQGRQAEPAQIIGAVELQGGGVIRGREGRECQLVSYRPASPAAF